MVRQNIKQVGTTTLDGQRQITPISCRYSARLISHHDRVGRKNEKKKIEKKLI